MHRLFAAAFALALAAPLTAQSIADQSQAVPLPGSWSYAATADGSEAIFTDSNRQPQLSLRCVRSTRRIFLSKPSIVAVPALAVWSSTATKSLPAAFDSANSRLVAQLANWDPLLDAITYSRGRFAVAAGAQQPLVVPAWADISRVVEDCRA